LWVGYEFTTSSWLEPRKLLKVMKILVHISTLIATAVLAGVGNKVYAVGASVPFTEYEAESGALGGSASIVQLQLPLGNSANGEAVNEASGAAYVSLSHTGDSVSWKNNTGQSITALNFRINIPDAPNGGGINATLGLYINGTFRQNLFVSSQQVYVYGGKNNDKNPADGNPTRIWDEFPLFPISGAAIAPGDTIMLQKDSNSTASFYNVDLIDLETPPAALSQPANSLSIASYGAVANDSSKDNTSSIQNCINAAQSQGKSVWIPQGKFYMGLNGTGGLNIPSGVTVNGAGIWYSTLYDNPSNPSSGGQMIGGVGCTLQDFAMDCNSVSAGCSSATGMSGSNWTVNRVWFRHTSLAVWGGGDHGLVANTRVNNTWSDGENMNNFSGNSTTGQYLTETNNFLRFTGDDALAVNGTDSSGHTPMNNIFIANNTIVQTAGRIVVYGGSIVTISNNWCHDLVQNDGIQVGYHQQTAGITNVTVVNNLVERCGNAQYGGVPGMLAGSDFSTPVDQQVTFNGNTIRHSYFDGFGISIISSVTFQNNLIDSPGRNGIVIASEAANGTASITGNTVQNLSSGNQPYVDNAGSSEVVTLSGNSWQNTAPNLALNQPVTVSSVADGTQGSNAVDGNLSTRWGSAYSDPQWIYVDLGASYNVTNVVLYWETAYGKAYQIQVSPDASTWTTIFSTSNGSGGTENLTGLSGVGRYVRMYGTQRGTQWGYSLWEFQVYGSSSGGGSTPQSGSTYHLICQRSGMALDNGGSTTAGAKMTQWTDTSNDSNQEWKLTDMGNGYFHLDCQKSGMALDNAGSTTDGTAVTQWTDNGVSNQNQNWKIVSVGNGWYHLDCQSSGKALDNGGSTTTGTTVNQWTDNGASNNNQNWKFEFIR
jgi:hypothetical protein